MACVLSIPLQMHHVMHVTWWPALPRHLRRAPSEFDIRQCQSSDVPKVIEIFSKRLPGLSGIRGYIESNSSIGLHDKSTGEMLAVVTVKFHDSCDFAEILFLSSGQSSQGFGSILMRHVKDVASKRNLHFVVVQASNDAVQYFSKNGFRVYDATKHISREVFMSRIYKPTNVTLMIFDFGAEPEFIHQHQRLKVLQHKIGDPAQVQYGMDTRRPQWRPGRVQSIDGVFLFYDIKHFNTRDHEQNCKFSNLI